MVKLYDTGAYLVNGTTIVPEAEESQKKKQEKEPSHTES